MCRALYADGIRTAIAARLTLVLGRLMSPLAVSHRGQCSVETFDCIDRLVPAADAKLPFGGFVLLFGPHIQNDTALMEYRYFGNILQLDCRS